jgi:oligoendopeptidase F
MINAPTYVLLNYVDKLNDVSTLAHEMGHAIHSDLSKKQESIYQDYPISVAEVASTFFENVLFDNLLEIALPEEKRDLLVNKVQDNVFTIFAQIAYFQYEKNIHKAVKEKGYLSKEEFASMFAECRKSYVGDSVEVVETDGYGYVYINHFRYFFYVYSYAYGQLIANAMYEEYKKDKSFGAKIKKFLSAGGSATPEDIFKSIGIDTSKPDFFLKGLKKIEKDLDAVEGMF